MLANLFKRGEEEEGVEKEGRRYIFWRKRQGLENNLTEHFIEKIREKVRTAAYLRHNYSHRRTGTFGLGGAAIFLPEKITQCPNV